MPAPESIPPRARDARPVLGHVNLMVDTLIANASIDDLRAIVRSTLATTSPPVASAFTAAARHRLGDQCDCPTVSVRSFHQERRRNDRPDPRVDECSRSQSVLYGAGMGLASLGVLGVVVRATVGLRWEEGSSMENILASIDADISQAIQIRGRS
ncbi:hypothetical protein A0H81_05081 [Grifola frondosa]|uniref:Uncharacterized protein n=1 Tax=Grifola frondosa TaxID=5627 RepID=A0A1C7MEB4_GRIFR|nr:hypothetical protein A0H81_05081 [Grifola frondosa]